MPKEAYKRFSNPSRTQKWRRLKRRRLSEQDSITIRQHHRPAASISLLSYEGSKSPPKLEYSSDSFSEEELQPAGNERCEDGSSGSGESRDCPRDQDSHAPLMEAISSWATTEGAVSEQSLTRLLKSLKRFDPSVPVDAKKFYSQNRQNFITKSKNRHNFVSKRRRESFSFPNWITEMMPESDDEIDVTSSAVDGNACRSLPEESSRLGKNTGRKRSFSHAQPRRECPEDKSRGSSQQKAMIQIMIAMGKKIEKLCKEVKDIKKLLLGGSQPGWTMGSSKLPFPASTLDELSHWFEDIDDGSVHLAAMRTEVGTLRSTVTNIIRIMMSRSVAMQFTWSGMSEKNDKQKFRDSEAHLFLSDVINCTCHKNATQDEIRDAVKKTFYNASDWSGGRKARRIENEIKLEG